MTSKPRVSAFFGVENLEAFSYSATRLRDPGDGAGGGLSLNPWTDDCNVTEPSWGKTVSASHWFDPEPAPSDSDEPGGAERGVLD